MNLPSPEVLETLPENVRIAVIEAAAFSGPLPPPTMYGEYDNVLSGSAERILRMAEKEQDHRIEWENNALNQNTREVNRGQWFGLVTAILCIVAAVYLSMNENPWVAAILAGASPLGLVARFLRGRQKTE